MDYPIISADDHIQEPPDLWSTRLPKNLRDRAPKVITLADGGRVEGVITKLEGGKMYVRVSETPVGFREIRLRFDLDTDAPADQVAKLVAVTERYCVVFQTLRNAPALTVHHAVRPT